MHELALSFVASFVLIFFRAFQQRNVSGSNYRPMIPTSVAMSIAEVWLIAVVARSGTTLPLMLAIAIGLGGGCGAMAATLAHNRVFRRHD